MPYTTLPNSHLAGIAWFCLVLVVMATATAGGQTVISNDSKIIKVIGATIVNEPAQNNTAGELNFSAEAMVIASDSRRIRVTGLRQTELSDPTKLQAELGESLSALFRAYEAEDLQGFMRYIHSSFTSRDTSNNRQNVSLLRRAAQDDFKILDGIQHKVFVKNITVQRNGQRAQIELRWNRRAILTRTSQEWIIRDQQSRLFFEKDKHWKLLAVQGQPLFGLARPTGEVVIVAGTLNNQPVTKPVTVGVVKPKTITVVLNATHATGECANLATGAKRNYTSGPLIPYTEIALTYDGFTTIWYLVAQDDIGLTAHPLSAADVGTTVTDLNGKPFVKSFTVTRFQHTETPPVPPGIPASATLEIAINQ